MEKDERKLGQNAAEAIRKIDAVWDSNSVNELRR